MTPQRAKHLLGRIWGAWDAVTDEVQAEIDAEKPPTKPGQFPESNIATLQRIAGDNYDWQAEPDWNIRRAYFSKYV